MKKLMMFVAIVCATTFVNAASMAWGISNLSATPDKAAAAGWVAYFMDGSKYSTFSGLEASEVGAYVAANKLYSATSTSGRTGVNVSATSGTYSAGDSVSGYMVIFDNASATAADYYVYTALDTKSVPGAGNLQFTKTFAETSGWTATSGGSQPDVPEPTSGMLMLIGLAGLALRRRRA